MRATFPFLFALLVSGSLLATTQRSVPEVQPRGKTMVETIAVAGRCAEDYAQQPADYSGAVDRIRHADGSEEIRGMVVASMTEARSAALFNRQGGYRPPHSIHLSEHTPTPGGAARTSMVVRGTSRGYVDWPLGYSAICWLSVVDRARPDGTVSR